MDGFLLSHPARGAWIEIWIKEQVEAIPESRTPQGVRGLKYFLASLLGQLDSRTPQGVRGLK